jgi:hypothetical protein
VHFGVNYFISKCLLRRASLHVHAQECTAKDRQLAPVLAPVFSQFPLGVLDSKVWNPAARERTITATASRPAARTCKATIQQIDRSFVIHAAGKPQDLSLVIRNPHAASSAQSPRFDLGAETDDGKHVEVSRARPVNIDGDPFRASGSGGSVRDYANMEPPKCYLFPKAIERVDPFLPTLKDLVESGTFLLACAVLLNLLEVAPRTSHLPLIVAASKSWLAAFPDVKAFWIDQGIGWRLFALMDAVLTLDPQLFAPDQASRKDIDRLLESLVRIGIAEAYRLEERLRALR